MVKQPKRCSWTCIRDPYYEGEYDQLIIVARQAPHDERVFWTTVNRLQGNRSGASYVCEYHVPTLLLAEIINVRV